MAIDEGRAVKAPSFEAPRPRHGLIGPFGGRQLAIALAVVVVAGGLLFAVTRPIASAPSGPAATAAGAGQYVVGPVTEGLRVGQRAPELLVRRSDGSTAPLTDLSGNPISLAALRGHPVWINFWASWCPPCQAEMPVIRDLYNSYRDRGLQVVAVDVQESSVADVAAYAAKYQLRYTIGADLSGDVFRTYRIYGLPTQFFLDSNGVIRSIVQGPVDYNLAIANLNGILPSVGPSAAASATP